MRQLKVIILLSYLFTGFINADETASAKQTIEQFYKGYLIYYQKTSDAETLPLKFSKAFKADIEKNNAVCTEYATGVCGWNASGDEYLNTQEADPTLTYENSGIRFQVVKPNTIEVRLNIFPSTQDPYYDRVIQFKMTQENGEWVVDDIAYDEKGESSVREYIRNENAEYLANPDPDSKAMKKTNKIK